jgi:putative intracellular protease/amidase
MELKNKKFVAIIFVKQMDDAGKPIGIICHAG